MKLREIMTSQVEIIQPDDTLQAAAKKMRDRDVGFLPVCDGETLMGVLSDRDITVRALAEGMDGGDAGAVEGQGGPAHGHHVAVDGDAHVEIASELESEVVAAGDADGARRGNAARHARRRRPRSPPAAPSRCAGAR